MEFNKCFRFSVVEICLSFLCIALWLGTCASRATSAGLSQSPNLQEAKLARLIAEGFYQTGDWRATTMVSVFPSEAFALLSAWMEKGIRLSGIGSTQHERVDEWEDDLSWKDNDAASVCWGARHYIQIAYFPKNIDFICGITCIWDGLNPIQLTGQV